MIDADLLRSQSEKIKKAVYAKGANPSLIDKFLELDQEWRKLVKDIDDSRARQNKFSQERQIEKAKENKERIKSLESRIKEVEEQRLAVWRQIPNPALADVPSGKNEADNVVLREVGKKPKFVFPPRDYLALAQKLNLIDTESAAKVSGSRFGYLLGAAVRLEWALGQLVLETLTNRKTIALIAKKNKLKISDQPFIPVIPPVLINQKSMSGMGYLERGSEEVYYLPKDELYLIGTSEQAIGPKHQDDIFDFKDLPRRYLSFSTCFRREAGSYGKDTKGILRVHQFDKWEMFSFVEPEKSEDEHRFLLAIEEYLMQKLEIPYQVLQICTGDLGDPAVAKFDIEAWLPGQNNGQGEYRETHSTSNTTDYQARRLNIKYRSKSQTANSKSIKYVHMLNGTAFAIGRTLIAIFENYQTKEGNIKIPKVLQKYVGQREIL